MSIYSQRINRLAKKYNLQKYLEIGVCAGDTFFNVDIPHRSAVDPNFLFDPKSRQDKSNTYYFNMPSDLYFDNITKIKNDVYREDIKFDLIFIDGLHTYEQTLKDFTNSFVLSHANTIWIFDDTVPSDPYSTVPDMQQCYKYRQLAGINSNAWHGDVFKCVFAIHDFYPDFSYVTVIDKGNPQTVVWRAKNPGSRGRICDSWRQIASLNYFDMLSHCNYFNLITDSELETYIGKALNDCEASPANLAGAIVRRLPIPPPPPPII